MKIIGIESIMIALVLAATSQTTWADARDPQPVPGRMVSQFLGTRALSHETRRDRGALSGCQIVFSVMLSDYVYARGNLVTIDGSISLIGSAQQGIAGYIRIVGSDVYTTRDQFIDRKFESDFGYFLNSIGDPFPVLDSFICENGGYCAVVDPVEILGMLDELVTSGQLVGGINRAGGETDLPFTIDSNAIEASMLDLEFAECAVQLATGSSAGR